MHSGTGATAETIADVIRRRVGKEEMEKLTAQYGADVIEDALIATGLFHCGCEEIGSSDVYYMIQSFRRNLEP